MLRLLLMLGPIWAALLVTNAWGSDDDILFAKKDFVDTGATVAISGTLTGSDIAYKNNTYSINCIEDRKECWYTSIEQIGDRQIGRLEYASALPITKWGAEEIIATDVESGFACWKTTITTNRKAQTGLWVEEPINRSRSHCQKAHDATWDKVRKYTIEDSLGQKKLQGR